MPVLEDVPAIPSYQLMLHAPLRQLTGEDVVVEYSDELTPAAQAKLQLCALAKSVQQQLQQIQQSYNGLQQQLPMLATDIARTILKDSEFLQQRIEKFAELALESIPAQDCELLSHPDCIEALQGWLEQGEFQFKVQLVSDPTIALGDCRIRVGQIGVEARLDELLHTIQSQLTKQE